MVNFEPEYSETCDVDNTAHNWVALLANLFL